MIIKVDTREQNEITFTTSETVSAVIREGLPFGDYLAEWEPGSEKAGFNCEMPVVFERKGLQDLFGTLTSGMERFKQELERAKENGFKVILIIEGTLSEVLAGTKYSKVQGKTIIKTMFTLWMKYDVVPVFCPNRSEMRRFMLETFEAIGRNFKPNGKSNKEN